MALNSSDRLILIKLRKTNTEMSLTSIATATGLSCLTAQRRCIDLCNAGYLERHRISRITYYSVTEAAPAT